MTEKTDIAALREAALMATAGEWCTDSQHSVIADAGLNENYYVAACSGPGSKINAKFIALANPATIITLLDQLEAERQRADAAESYARERDSENESIALTVGRLRTELAALRGAQEPVGLIKRKTPLLSDGAFRYSFISDVNLPLDTEIFTNQPKPVVVLSDCDIAAVSHMAHWYTEEQCEAWVAGVEHAKKQMLAAGIVVKDGE